MIRGVYSISGDEVRLKLLHQVQGSRALQSAWTASDRWLVETFFTARTLLLGAESDRETKKSLRTYMRADLSVTVVPSGLFQDRVDELIEFDVAIPTLAAGPSFGIFWTMAGGFDHKFARSLSPSMAINGSLANFLHEAPIMQYDGPNIVLYRNFFDNETCVRFRRSLWDAIAEKMHAEFSFPIIEKANVSFAGETYDLSSSVRLERNFEN